MWLICLWAFSSGEFQVYLWMFRCGYTVLLTTKFFDVAKFTMLTPLLLLYWCRLSFPIGGMKVFSLSTFALKSPNRIFVCYLVKWYKTCIIPHKTTFWITTFLLTGCMHIQNNDIKPVTSQNYIWHPIANKLYPPNSGANLGLGRLGSCLGR